MNQENNSKNWSNVIPHISFLAAFVFLFGCKDSTSQGATSTERNDFVIQKSKADDFYVLCSSLDDTKAPKSIAYLFNGSIQNNTQNIYAEATLHMEASIELENGTVLTRKEIDKNLFGGVLSLKSIRNFKPKEEVKIERLESFKIPVEYAAYPIKDVFIQYSVELVDQINQTNEEKLIKTMSVVDKWRHAVAKAKSNKTDANDYDFPEKIIGRYKSK